MNGKYNSGTKLLNYFTVSLAITECFNHQIELITFKTENGGGKLDRYILNKRESK